MLSLAYDFVRAGNTAVLGARVWVDIGDYAGLQREGGVAR